VILVDTSVWIDHFRVASLPLVDALKGEQVLMHPFVVGELACGTLKNRREVLDLMERLPRAVVATDDEVLLFIEHNRLMGKGIGYVDAHLLAATSLTEGAQLRTRDRRLSEIAASLRLL